MNPAQKLLFTGALKSAVSEATGLILALPLTDAEHFNIQTVGGWKHLGITILVVVLVGEARFWKQWADSTNNAPKP
jgi:hypothetical protein